MKSAKSEQRDLACEFCMELNSDRTSRFAAIYSGVLATRVVDQQGMFRAMPTLGQILEGSMLVLPVEHYETFADIPYTEELALLEIIQRVSAIISSVGHVIGFEHGARCRDQWSCGIYHAHLHLVPVPDELVVSDVLPPGYEHASSLPAALHSLRGHEGYLLMTDVHGNVAYLRAERAPSFILRSQWFRQFLVNRYRPCNPWAWQEYTEPEDLLIRTVFRFGMTSRCESKSVLAG